MATLLLLFIVEVWAGFVLQVDLTQIGIVPANCSPELNYNVLPVRGNSICPLYYVNQHDNDDDDDEDEHEDETDNVDANAVDGKPHRHNRSKGFIE